LAALGGAAGYYYNSTQTFKTKTVPVTAPGSAPLGNQSKDIDYQKIYNEIADMLDEDSE
jgi:cytochrome c peroxidase